MVLCMVGVVHLAWGVDLLKWELVSVELASHNWHRGEKKKMPGGDAERRNDKARAWIAMPGPVETG
jgi:hypothetical protein